MADATLTLDAEIDTDDFENGTKDIIKALEDIEFAIRETDGSLNDIGDATGTASSKFGKFGAAAGAVGGLVSSGIGMAVDAIADLTGDIVEASDSADKFRSTLEFSGLDTSTIDALTESTQAYADQTVYSISDIRNVTAQLAANGVADYDKLAEAAGNLNAVAGGNADTFGSVGMVLTQTAGAGKLTTENWNQLADAIPGASGKLQEAMLKNGAYTGNFRDALENGEISAEEFNQAIMDLGMTDAAQEAATSTDTIEGAMGNLEASVVGVGTTILDQFKGPLTSGISMLAQGISGLSGVFTGLVQTIGPILSQIGTVFQTAFAPIGEMITTQLLPALQPLMGALQNLANAVMPVIMTAIQTIAPVLATLVGNVIQTMSVIATAVTPVINNIAALIQAAMPAIQTAFQIMGDVVSGVINAVFPVIQSVIETVMGVIQSVIQIVTAAINGDWEGVWNGMKDLIDTVWNGIKSIVDSVINAVKGIIDSVLNGIKDVFTNIWNAIKGTVEDVWNGIKDTVSNAIENVQNTVENVLNSIKDFFSDAWNAATDTVSNAWNNITNTVSNGVNNVINFVRDIPNKIKSFFSNAGSLLLDAGRQIINGLIRGITGAVSGAISAVKNAVGSIIDGAKSLLGIASPSKVFRDEIGKYIPEGMAIGIERSTPDATKAIQGMTDSLMVSAQPLVGVDAIPDTSSQSSGLDVNMLTQAFLKALQQLPEVRTFRTPDDASVWLGRAMDEQLAKRSNRRKVFA